MAALVASLRDFGSYFLNRTNGAPPLPERVRALIRTQDMEAERLIGWVQLGLAATLTTLYTLAPRPEDAAPMVIAAVPVALLLYVGITSARLWFSYRRPLPEWAVTLSIVTDIGLLLGLIWFFHIQYGQPAGFSLKVPTFVYLFVLVSLRSLRFDPRYVLTAGVVAALGWGLITLLATMSSDSAVTRNFVTYITTNNILIGAEFDKVFAILLVTGLLAAAIGRAQRTLVTAVREEQAGREIKRFLSLGVGEAIAQSENLIGAGEAAEREAAVMMIDIRGFTQFSAEVSPREVVRILTSFHARIIPIVRGHNGVVDKFLGDGVMATFGAAKPSARPAADALTALDRIMAEAADWQTELVAKGISKVLRVNGAVAAGPVVFATLGNDDRLEYTVIGDAANLAAKLEKHNKTEGTRALTTVEVYERAIAEGYVPGRREVRAGATVAGVAAPLDLVVLA